jgi:crossover junction endodeoxyribonuclease RusA
VNTYWRHKARGGNLPPIVYIGDAGKNYRSEVAILVAQARGRAGRSPLAGPLRLEVEAHPPDQRKRDIDNLLKALLDALQAAGAYTDDNQVEDLRIRRREVVPRGGVLVTITETTSEATPPC